jgi:hypothetical protein
MADISDQAPRRGMSFPFFLTVVLFGALLADRYLLGGDVPEPGRPHPYIFVGVTIVGFLLWLWVLIAARHRATSFAGPIQTVRGSNGALQPILATILIVIAVSLAHSYSIPKWFGAFAGDSSPFVSDVDPIFDVTDDEPASTPAPEEDESMPTAEDLLDAIIGADDEEQSRTNKTGRSQRGAPQ